ncbi:hypothetical protein N0V93_004178 [Gnomoniopsis smithogilvyi]|uniref:Uncharacterized protein n=1 Tax=Gnomoniopsis smithogilvyi TaxID=1191159 RepID=A0A9W8YU80_9PEZI|nr:hypothetical protein N0V93_004178 [Gnomoniopsis smithogilvyi]
MALLNPVYGLIVPFLFVVTIPLAILAGVTTTLAFTVLMFRVAVVYLDIAVNMVPQYVTGRRIFPFPGRYMSSLLNAAVSNLPPPTASPVDSRPTSGQSTPSPTTTTSRAPVVRHHRRRRTSGASFNSVGSITPIDDGAAGIGSKRNSFMLIPSIGMDRDFEGVGGWRLNGRNPADDEAWAQLNSRLELPLDQQRRHHRRSPSGGGAITPRGSTGGDYLMMKSPRATRSKEESPENTAGRRGRDWGKASATMSPNSSRQRTPTGGMPPPLTTIDSDASASYFPPVSSPKSARRSIF